MKSYTDLEQSRKLAKILPLDSADMYFIGHQSIINPKEWEYEDMPKVRGKYIAFDDKRIFYPCWSLAALYDILPNNKKESTTLSRGGWKIYPIEYLDNWWGEYEDESHTKDFAVSADNPVNACYELILKLNELNLF